MYIFEEMMANGFPQHLNDKGKFQFKYNNNMKG